jgi:pyridoxal phosphate enzyme (YggS family)
VSRLDELAANLAEVRTRLEAAATAAGRDPHTVTLIAVTKTWPASDVRLLAQLGVTEVGENRDQEAAPKHDACRDLRLRWHFVGQLQRNKAGSVASYADVVHSVDRLELVPALDRQAARHGRRLTALVQVALADDVARGGAPPPQVAAVADAIAGSQALDLGGVMAVAPLGADPDRAFARLADVAAALRRTHPAATTISAGMSGDLEAAVSHGATHVRIGTALLGPREPSFG